MKYFKLTTLFLFLFIAACSLQEEAPPFPTPPPGYPQVCTPPTCLGNDVLICLEGDCADGCGLVCGLNPSTDITWWQPAVDSRFYIQYSGKINYDDDAEVYNLDLFDTPTEMIEQLHQRGVQVICYFSAGTIEDWRPDVEDFPEEVIGEALKDWEGESWLDISNLEALAPIMTARMDLAVEKGCDGVDPDNINGYTQNSGFALTAEDQLIYNHWLAEQAHVRDLAIGLKNDLEQIPTLVGIFDFAVNEECFAYNECSLLLPFIQLGKPVFGIEYKDKPENFCPQANQIGFQTILKHKNLDAFQVNCWDE